MKQLRLALAPLVTLALVLIGFYALSNHHARVAARERHHKIRIAVASTVLPVKPSSYLGVFAHGVPQSYQPIEDFTRSVAHSVNIALYYSGWGEDFARNYADQAWRHGAVPMVQIDVYGGAFADIVAGKYDLRIRQFAAEVASFRHPVIIGFDPEMNGPWYSWGWHHEPTSLWIAAYRHYVNTFRDVGATNVTWLWTINRVGSDTGAIGKWWPGSKYVTWIGIDGYFYSHKDSFRRVFGTTIAQVRAITNAPILLSETAVGQLANQRKQIPELFAGVQSSGVLGFVWFDRAQHSGRTHQDWRLEDSPKALTVFRQKVRSYNLVKVVSK
jgi:glycosyl hydrolase family 26